MSYEKNFAMLKLALELLGELSEELVFVGGSTTCLYIEPSIADEIRPTEDVDCVIEAYSRKEYNQMEKKIRGKGFVNDTRPKAPLCRFRYKEVLTLDLMPDNEEILGFTNSWYKSGVKNKILEKVDEYSINIFSQPYFLASKFEAFENRGSDDPRFSSDLEDIILVLDGAKEMNFSQLKLDLSTYLSSMAQECLTNREIKEAIQGFLPSRERVEQVREKLNIIHRSIEY